MSKYVPNIMSDAEALAISDLQRRDSLYGTPVPPDEWIGPGADDEFRDGKGADSDSQ